MSTICAGCWTSICGTTTQHGRTVPSASSPRLRPVPGHPHQPTLLSARSAGSRSSAGSPTSTTSPPYHSTPLRKDAGHLTESHFRAPQVAEAGFDRMRDRAGEVVPQATMDGLWHDTSRFFHCGTSGQWRTFLSSEDLDRYQARVRRLADPDLATWAHGGWWDYRRLKRAGFQTPS